MTTTDACSVQGVNAAELEAQAALVDRLRAGDAAAFEELVRAKSGRLLAVARRILGSEDLAQDALQDAFVSAFKSLHAFDGRSLLTTWLHRIVVNTCLMKLRSRRCRPEESIEGLLPDFLEDGHHASPIHAWPPSAAQAIEQDELRRLVRNKIDELPESYREIIILRDIEELDTAEAAAALGMTAQAVKTRLHRARQALRTLLDPHLAPTAAAARTGRTH